MKPMTAWTVAIAGCVLGVSEVRADQCAFVEERIAERAAGLLADRPNIVELCEPCGDTVPGRPAIARKASARRVDPTSAYYELDVELAGGVRAIDLAYLYVEQSDGKYRNVAGLVGCPATGVSPVIILGRVTDVEPVAEVEVPPMPTPAATPAVTLSTASGMSAWWYMLAGGAGAIFGTITTLFAFARVRRRAVLPRATNL